MTDKKYTHTALMKAGYRREAPDKRRGVGFVRYLKRPFEDEIVFAGNNATMEKWTEQWWKPNFPELYKWWTDPKQTQPYVWWLNLVFIKGEDPMLKEGQDGSQDSEPGI